MVARRYAFEPAEIEVTVGETVRLMVRSSDGLHGIEIKQFKVKKELERGADPVAIDHQGGHGRPVPHYLFRVLRRGA